MSARDILVSLLIYISPVYAVEPPIVALAIAPGDITLISGSQNGIDVRQWPDLKVVRRFPTDLSHVHDLTFSNDGKMLAIAGGKPGQMGSVEIRRWPDGERISRSDSHRDIVYAVAWTKENNIVAVSGDGTIQVIDAKSGRTIKTLEGHARPVLCVAVLPQNGSIITGGADDCLRVWDPSSGQLLRTLANHTRPVLGLAIKPKSDDQPMVASIGADRTVRIWQPNIGRLVRFARIASEPRAIAWTHDGQSIVVACVDGRIRVINRDDAEVTAEFPALSQPAHCLVLTSDGHAVVGGSNGQLTSVRLQSK